MNYIPTNRRLDIIAAWHRCGNSNTEAGRMLNLSPQIIRNELHHTRREAGVKDNAALVKRYWQYVKDRNPLPTRRAA